jgi:hypothetical protein
MGMNIVMYATSAGGNQNGLAQIDSPATGNILGCYWNGLFKPPAGAASTIWELSFGSAYTIQNDSRMIVSTLAIQKQEITAVGEVFAYQPVYHPMVIPISMGERLWLHCAATAADTSQIICIISFDFDLDRPSVRRR